MNALIAILIRTIEVMFVAGVGGSAIVVLLTSVDDFKMLFQKATLPKVKVYARAPRLCLGRLACAESPTNHVGATVLICPVERNSTGSVF